MNIFIGGSLAYDFIMSFEGQFKDQLLADHLDNVNVSFFAPTLVKEFGGTGGNIAYNCNLLGMQPLVCASVGQDFEPYRSHFDQAGISLEYVNQRDDSYTAQMYAINDKNMNQINAFHPGAMDFTVELDVPNIDFNLAILAPSQPASIIKHARQLSQRSIPFIFDPGQVLPLFTRDELIELVERANWLIVNEYESHMLQKNTALSLDALADSVDAFIITKGDKGSVIHTGGEAMAIEPVSASAELDPTGCGDAYRSGILLGLINKLPWQQIGQMGAVMGAIKVEHSGTQNHRPSMGDIRARYELAYGEPYPI